MLKVIGNVTEQDWILRDLDMFDIIYTGCPVGSCIYYLWWRYFWNLFIVFQRTIIISNNKYINNFWTFVKLRRVTIRYEL
jgi:hypothetical protein